MAIQVGLIDTTGTLNQDFVKSVANALNLQVTTDLLNTWGTWDKWDTQATVIWLDPANPPASNAWQVQLVNPGDMSPTEPGVHIPIPDAPYAKVAITPGSNDWTLAASHETIEMLVDPNGNKLWLAPAIQISGLQIQTVSGNLQYLVEACDPCQTCWYPSAIAGIKVADFLTQRFYDAGITPGVNYSFKGNITAPRQVLPGGYITYTKPDANDFWQISWLDPQQPSLEHLGPPDAGLSLREWVDSKILERIRAKARKRPLKKRPFKNVPAVKSKAKTKKPKKTTAGKTAAKRKRGTR